MPMLDDAMFDPATYAPTAGMLAQMFGTPTQGGAPPAGWAPGMAPPMDVPYPPGGLPSGPMSNGDGGKLMPVPVPPPSAGAQVDQAALPPNSTPATDIPRGNVPETSMLGRLGDGALDFLKGANEWRKNNRATLMALGAGMAGSQSLGQGLSRGMQLALPAQQQDLAQQKQNQTARWLVEKKGMSPQEAEAVVNNPEMMKQLLPRLMGAKQLKWTKVGTDALGGDKMGWIDEAAGKRYDDSGKEITAATASGGAGGVGDLDSSLIGEEYLNQKAIPPELRAAVKDYVSSMSMPTGNPRKGPAQAVKFIAEKYANDLGLPVDEAGFAGRRKMITDLNSSGNSSMGGILSNGKSAFDHLANLSDKYAALGNFNGPDIPGGGNIGMAGNVIGNRLLPTPAQKDALAQAADNALKYGQESTKFYAGSGGGEGERMAALRNIDPRSSSSMEQAGFLETEKQLMLGRLSQKEAQLRTEMGPAFLAKHPVMTPELQKSIEKIDANIARLRGQGAPAAPGQAAAPAAGPSTTPTEGSTATGPNGVKVILRGNKWVPVQ